MKHLFLAIFLLTFIIGNGQNNLLNESKYWVWRDRLVNDYMVPNYTGDYAHKGRGVVFKKRGTGWFQDINYTNWINNQINIKDTASYSGGFDISDEGFEMGKYLIVLATEWRLLFNSGLPTQQTEAELFWALKTIDRLDYDAETYWSYFWSRGQETWGGQLNGFMIRDDVFTNFLWYNENFPTVSNHIDDAYFNFYNTYYNEIPPYIQFHHDAYENYRYLNQGNDGRIGKYIPQNIMLCTNYYPFEVETYDLRELMKKIRLTHAQNTGYGYSNYMYPKNGGFSAAMAGIYACYDDTLGGAHYNRQDFRNHHWTGPEEFSQDNYIGLLQGLVAVQQLVNSNVNVNGYGLASYAAHIIDRIIYSIKKNDSYGFLGSTNWTIDNPVTGFCVKGVYWDKIIDRVIGSSTWDELWGHSPQYHENRLGEACNEGGGQSKLYSYALCKIHELYTASCSDCHERGCNTPLSGDIGYSSANSLDGPFLSDNARLLAAILGTLSGIMSNERCCQLIAGLTHDNFFVDDDYNQNEDEFQYLDLLYCYLHGNNSSNPIRGFLHYCNILDTTICPDNQRVGNLLSEMIIHNLLKILKGEKYQYSIFDHNTYPSATTLCTQSQVTFGSIESEATITQSPTSGCIANVTYKAGKEIHLKPGFKVINGAKFHGYIEQMDVCQVKEGNPEVAVLFFPPSSEQLSPYVSNLNYTKEELFENNNESKKTVINNTILLYPNPVKDMLTLQSEISVSYSVDIYDSMGQFIERKIAEPNQNISVSHLKRGIYIFKIFNQNELVQIQKIVLQ
ncbi:MAG: hypothetical protein Fur0028_09130 [Bacteroidales bacterium]